MSKFIRHERCPVCGSDDNLAIYDDGYHCFSPGCSNSNGQHQGVAPNVPTSFRMPGIKAIGMPKRNIPERIIAKFGCGVEYKTGFPVRFHFPNYKDGSLVGTKYRIVDEGGITWEDKQFRWIGESAGLFGMQAARDRGSVIIHEGECYTGDTEVLTPNGWVRLENYEAQEVAQYDKGKIEFVYPDRVISHSHSGKIKQFTNHRKFSLCVTPGHKNIYLSPDGDIIARTAEERYPSAKHTIIRTAEYDPGTERQSVQLTESELRLIVAVSADAGVEFTARGMVNCDFNLKKQRKIDRLRALVDECGVDASFCVHTSKPDYTRVRMTLPRKLAVGRLFPHDWISKLRVEQRECIIRELKEWDGWEDPEGKHCEYTSKYHENATFIQTIATLNGYVTNICPFTGSGTAYGDNVYYKVNIHYNAEATTLGSVHVTDIDWDDYVYCLTVPSGMLLVRHNNCISVSGNCDAMAGSVMMGVSFSNVSITHGAKGAVDDVKQCWKWLDKYESIYLSFDSDEPGRVAAANVAALFKPGKCKVVVHPTGFKDANDYLVRDAVEDYKNAVYAAQVPKPEGLIRPDELKSLTREFLFNKENWQGISTGIRGMDKVCGGLRPGSLITVYGGTGLGKTSFVRQIAFNVVQSGHPVLFIPLEMRVTEVATQILEMYLKRRILQYEAGKLTLTEDEFNHAANVVYQRLFMVKHFGAFSLLSLTQSIEHAARVEGVKLVILDHKDAAVNSGDENDSNVKAIDALMGKLKETALALSITIIVVSHISRSAMDRDDVIPDLSRIRNSSGVAQNSDVVFGVTRPRNSNILQVLTKKGDRFTSGNGQFQLAYNTDTLCYEEINVKAKAGEANEEAEPTMYAERSYSEEYVRGENNGIESIIGLRTSVIEAINTNYVHTGLEVNQQEREGNLCGEQGLSETGGQNQTETDESTIPRTGLEATLHGCRQTYLERQKKLDDLW